MNTALHEPPSKNIDTFEPQEHGITSEGELVQYLFRHHSSGDYIIHAPVGPNHTFKTLWEGEVQIEDNRNRMFQARQNNLLQWTSLDVQTPLVDHPKRIAIPDDLYRMVREQLKERDYELR